MTDTPLKDRLVGRLRYWEGDGRPHGQLHAEAADRIEALEREVERLRAENEHLSKATVSGILGDLLTNDETQALVDFVKGLRRASLSNISGRDTE